MPTPLRLALAAGLATLGLAAAAPAHAATLSVEQHDGDRYLYYAAGDGETNLVRVGTAADGRISVRDDGAVISPSGSSCIRVSYHEARCRADAAPALAVSLGDRDDALTVDAALPAYAGGGAGNDRLTGGPGHGGLWGGDGDDVLDGRGGADLLAGEAGTDTVRYADRSAPVTVDLVYGGSGTEGQAGERDTVASDVERVVGGAAGDSLTGNDGPNLLDGAGGDDVITGGRGADDLRGGLGRDTLRSRDGVVDRVDCGGDPDAIERDAADVVTGCEGAAAPAPATPVGTAPGPLTIPFSLTMGSVSVPDKPVVLQGVKVALSLSCPEGTPGGRCTGVLTLERTLPRAKGARAVASRRTKRRLRVGSQDYAVNAGRRTRVRVRVSRAQRRRLARRGTDRLGVYLRASRSARQGTRIGTLVVRASRRTKRRSASRPS